MIRESGRTLQDRTRRSLVGAPDDVHRAHEATARRIRIGLVPAGEDQVTAEVGLGGVAKSAVTIRQTSFSGRQFISMWMT